ncbi:hypothetical protein L6452_40003 [Arctium lappa]|uniref:Uncharacterized protein n=1 Tax=Arctium lappa TaxID=4217 RepID=A0ACB8XTX3_ARCLA|nr:hypothetical protein L6452_40003 [Arctium lappa]
MSTNCRHPCLLSLWIFDDDFGSLFNINVYPMEIATLLFRVEVWGVLLFAAWTIGSGVGRLGIFKCFDQWLKLNVLSKLSG